MELWKTKDRDVIDRANFSHNDVVLGLYRVAKALFSAIGRGGTEAEIIPEGVKGWCNSSHLNLHSRPSEILVPVSMGAILSFSTFLPLVWWP